MTTRRSEDLDVPAPPPDPPLPATALDFFAPPRLPFDVSPIAVLELMQRQRRRATEKAAVRHARRKRRHRA